MPVEARRAAGILACPLIIELATPALVVQDIYPDAPPQGSVLFAPRVTLDLAAALQARFVSQQIGGLD